MLPAPHRLRRPADFTAAVRHGRRSQRGSITIHFRAGSTDSSDSLELPARIGLIVGKTVGGSVVRHQVSRRLRAQMAQRIQLLPAGSITVIRAAVGAAGRTSQQLGADVDAALAVVLSPRHSR